MKITKVFISVFVLCALTACDALRDQLGGGEAPDEFAVIRRAPLERPPQIVSSPGDLPVPVRGKQRPQELVPIKQAEQTLIGKAADSNPVPTVSAGFDEVLEKSGANVADSTIRNTIDKEHLDLLDKERATIDRLLDSVTNKEPPAKIVDAKAEFERLKKNMSEGRSVSEGETPTLIINE